MKHPFIFKVIAIAAGGTGGHVFPGLAIAHELHARGIKVIWFGAPNSFESRIIEKTPFAFYSVEMQRLRGKGFWQWLKMPFGLTKALFQAKSLLKKNRVDAVLGMGGFISAPIGLAAWCLRKPLYLHEQNAIAGWSNRFLSPFSQKIFTGFSATFSNASKACFTGNPIRKELTQLPFPAERQAGYHTPLRLLVLGGSQGAKVINRLMTELLPLLPKNSVSVWHQTGKQDYEVTRERYQALTEREFLRVVPFIEDMSTAYQWADLVVCRAGALTLAELAAVGVGSILIPFPYAVDDHQTVNAQPFVAAGAAILIAEKEVTAEWLREKIEFFLSHPEKLAALAEAARTLAKPEATLLAVNAMLQ